MARTPASANRRDGQEANTAAEVARAKSFVLSTIEARVKEHTKRYAQAMASANWLERINQEAQLSVFRDRLKAAMGRPGLVPKDPLALMRVGDLRQSLDEAKRAQRELEGCAALFELPSTRVTLDSIGAYIKRLEAILTSDQPGTFHRARDALAEALDDKKWEATEGTHADAVAAERKRLYGLARADMPDIAWAFPKEGPPEPPDHPPTPEPPPSKPPRHPRSVLALKSLDASVTDPITSIHLEARLRSEYQELKGLQPEALRRMKFGRETTYGGWYAAQMNDADLGHAIARVVSLLDPANLGVSVADGPLPFDPKSQAVVALREKLVALTGEAEARRNGRSSGEDRYPTSGGKPEQAIATLYAESDAQRNGQPRVEKGNKTSGDQAQHPIMTLVSNKAASSEAPSAPNARRKAAILYLALERFGAPEKMPEVLAEEVGTYAREAMQRDFDRLDKFAQELNGLQAQAARATDPLPPALLDVLKTARESLRGAGDQLDRRVYHERAYFRGDGGRDWVVFVRSALNDWIRLFGDDPPAPAPPPPVPPPAPRDGEGPTGLVLADAVFEARMAGAEQAISKLRPKLKDRSSDFRKYATIWGRKVLPEKSVGRFIARNEGMKIKFERRLPPEMSDFNGRIDPETKKPYDFLKKVLRFKSFEPVGGGIHMGHTATKRSEADLSKFVLRYDAGPKHLVLIGPEGERFTYGPIEPTVLKALDAFVHSGQNCAVSIGWSGLETFGNRSWSGQSRPSESPVLLDPYFVDSPVGQTLVQADMLPWSLDKETLPNGRENPVATKFRTEYERFRKDFQGRLEKVTGLFKDVPPFDRDNWRRWADDKPPTLVADCFYEPLLRSRTISEAKRRVLDCFALPFRDYKSDLFIEKNPLADDSLRDIQSLLKAIDRAGDVDRALLDLVIRHLRYDLNQNRQIEARWIRLFHSIQLSRLPSYLLDRYASPLLVSTPGGLFLARFIHIVAEHVRERVHLQTILDVIRLLPKTTLAVLIDDPVEFQLIEGQIRFADAMTYRYATVQLSVTESGISLRDPKDRENQVRDIPSLTEIANKSYESLEALYPPLAETERYAHIAAFLRWANDAVGSQHLRGIDFSALAAVPGSDPKNTPTPNAIDMAQ